MRKLIYSMAVSLDGYINDARGSLDWVLVDEEYHRFANDQMRETGLSIYGFQMWQTMAFGTEFPTKKTIQTSCMSSPLCGKRRTSSSSRSASRRPTCSRARG